MAVANIAVIIFIRQLPSNGIFRLNGLYALGFETYCQIVLPEIVPVYIPTRITGARHASSPALGFHFCRFHSWQMAYSSSRCEFFRGGFPPYCPLNNLIGCEINETEWGRMFWRLHVFQPALFPLKLPMDVLASLNFCPKPLNWFPALWAGLHHITITPRSPPPSSLDRTLNS